MFKRHNVVNFYFWDWVCDRRPRVSSAQGKFVRAVKGMRERQGPWLKDPNEYMENAEYWAKVEYWKLVGDYLSRCHVGGATVDVDDFVEFEERRFTSSMSRGSPVSENSLGELGQEVASKTESAEQIKFVGRVRAFWPDTVVFAIPNGGNRGKMEATKLKEEGVLAGVSDLFVAEPRDEWHGLFIEMKRVSGGATSDRQEWFIQEMRIRGYRAEVAHGADEAWRIFLEYMGYDLLS